MSRQDAGPFQDSRYNEQFWASLYATLCGFGFAEVRLIWMRYSAFLVAQSALLGLIGREPKVGESWLMVGQSIVGLLVSCLWLLINSFGWNSQNLWYWHAARIRFPFVNFKLPTDSFAGEDVPKPKGPVFRVAQAV